MRLFIQLILLTTASPAFGEVFDYINPAVEFQRSSFVGFIEVEELQDVDGQVRITARIRHSLKGSGESASVEFIVPNPDDLMDDHDDYFVILYEENLEDRFSMLRAYSYQSVFPDFCEDKNERCYMLARRSSLFTQGNLIGIDALVEGFALIDDSIHAVVNWPEARSMLMADQELRE